MECSAPLSGCRYRRRQIYPARLLKPPDGTEHTADLTVRSPVPRRTNPAGRVRPRTMAAQRARHRWTLAEGTQLLQTTCTPGRLSTSSAPRRTGAGPAGGSVRLRSAGSGSAGRRVCRCPVRVVGSGSDRVRRPGLARLGCEKLCAFGRACMTVRREAPPTAPRTPMRSGVCVVVRRRRIRRRVCAAGRNGPGCCCRSG